MGDGAKARRVYEDAVEYLCRHVEDLRPLIDDAVWASHFPVVRDADPAGDDWRNAVRALHLAVEAAGIPNGLGLPAVMGVGNWPGSGVGHWPDTWPSRSSGWVCPKRNRCGRVELRNGADTPTPTCALGGDEMRPVGG